MGDVVRFQLAFWWICFLRWLRVPIYEKAEGFCVADLLDSDGVMVDMSRLLVAQYLTDAFQGGSAFFGVG